MNHTKCARHFAALRAPYLLAGCSGGTGSSPSSVTRTRALDARGSQRSL